MKNAEKRVFACKDRCRYSRKRDKFCRKFAKNWQLPYAGPAAAAAKAAARVRQGRARRRLAGRQGEREGLGFPHDDVRFSGTSSIGSGFHRREMHFNLVRTRCQYRGSFSCSSFCRYEFGCSFPHTHTPKKLHIKIQRVHSPSFHIFRDSTAKYMLITERDSALI